MNDGWMAQGLDWTGWVGGLFYALVFTIYIYIIYALNLGFEIALPGREREQGRFRGSTEGA